MQTVGERIALLRKSSKVGLTLEKFGSKIGFSKGAMSTMESGTRGVTEQTILAICREFNVNEEWLRNGSGPMFKEQSDVERIRGWVDTVLADTPDSYKVRLVAALTELDETGWDALYKLAVAMVGAREESKPEREPDAFDRLEEAGEISHEEAELMRTMRMERETGEKSFPSSDGKETTA